MVHQTSDADLEVIEQALQDYPGGASAQQILLAVATPLPLRTLQYRLKKLAGRQRIVKEGGGRSARYRRATVPSESDAAASNSQPSSDDLVVPISAAAAPIRDYVRRRPEARKPVGYDRAFLDDYRPNVSWYLSEAERRHLAQVGRPPRLCNAAD